jgi:recombinational DNA repair protein RecT
MTSGKKNHFTKMSELAKKTQNIFLKKMMASSTEMMKSLNLSDKESTENEKRALPGHRTRDNGIGVHPEWLHVNTNKERKQCGWWMVNGG